MPPLKQGDFNIDLGGSPFSSNFKPPPCFLLPPDVPTFPILTAALVPNPV